ncbi:MAG TPA: tetratricopeptide repeat protein [Terriglobia bacterium]|nr:tetratricopeptide repeat protein [Terriglobia bacterium]
MKVPEKCSVLAWLGTLLVSTFFSPTTSLRSDAAMRAQQAGISELFRQGRLDEEAGNLGAAESDYRKVLASDPGNPEALKRLGVLEQTELKFRDSIEHFQQILRVHSQYPQVNFFLGLSYYGLRDWDNAMSRLREELKAPDPHPATRYYLALALEAEGRSDEAIDQLNQVAVKNPDKPDVFYELARLHMVASFRAVEQLRRIDPDSFQSHAFLGQLYGEEGRYEAAIAEYQAALHKQPDAQGIHYPLGVAYRMLHQYDAAETEFLAALPESPDDPATNVSLGELAVREKLFNKGLPYLKKAAAGQPKDVETHLLLGRCYLGLNDLQKALDELSLAAQLDPANGRSHYFLAEVYQKLNRPADRQRELDLFNKLSGAEKSQSPGLQ